MNRISMPWQNPATCTSEPREMFPHVLDFCKSLVAAPSPIYLPVEAEPSDVVNECVSNVARRLQTVGGEMVVGWQIWEWHGVMIEGEFHAVWRDLNGQLHDVTPKPTGISRILFVEDRSLLSRMGQQTNNVRTPLIDDPRVRRFIEVADHVFEIWNRGDRAKQFGEVSLDRSEYVELQRAESEKATLMLAILASEPGRNDLCRCGSGTKWKKCHGR